MLLTVDVEGARRLSGKRERHGHPQTEFDAEAIGRSRDIAHFGDPGVDTDLDCECHYLSS